MDHPCSVASYQRYEFGDSALIGQSRCGDEVDGTSRKCNGMGIVETMIPLGGRGGLNRVKSLFTLDSNNVSMSDCSISSNESTAPSTETHSTCERTTPTEETCMESSFLCDMKNALGTKPNLPDFNSSTLRKVMEPHLRRARLLRESARGTSGSQHQVAASIASSMGVPYTALRRECPFLFDEHTHPLHTALANTLKVQDLSQVHHVDEKKLLLPLLDKEWRRNFHSAYDAFATSFCIPLLHSMALSKRVFQQSASDRIVYRYQAFPTIHISRPGGAALQTPTCDSVNGHTLGCLTFFVPLTPCQGTNCMFVESHPGKEDWHPLTAKAVGLGYLIDGARCLHFDLENTTEASRVSLTFRVMMYRDTNGDGNAGGADADDAAGLCPAAMLNDAFTTCERYYDEVVLDLQQRTTDSVVKKNGNRLLDPSPFVGYPFA